MLIVCSTPGALKIIKGDFKIPLTVDKSKLLTVLDSL